MTSLRATGATGRAAFSTAFVAAIFALSACAGGGGSSVGTKTAGSVVTESTSVGAQATDFTLQDLDGRNVSLSDYLKKDVVLLDFWATWCVPCGAEMPHLQKLYQDNKDKGFVLLGISMDGPETLAQVGPTARRYGIDFPVLLDSETHVVGIYNSKRTAPLSVLIDRKGHIVRIRDGYNAGDEKLVEADVASLLSAAH